jgi:hypothetical protein
VVKKNGVKTEQTSLQAYDLIKEVLFVPGVDMGTLKSPLLHLPLSNGKKY